MTITIDSGSRFDVVVVGARCAGAATAMVLARAGFDVALLDRARLPRDTTSTHALVRGGIVQLHRWGLIDRLEATGAPQIRSVTFHQYGTGGEQDRVRRPVKEKAGIDHLLAPRRIVLDQVLGDAAVAAGATPMTSTNVLDVLREPSGRVAGVLARDAGGAVRTLSAPLVVGADGVHSTVARLVGAPLVERHEPGSACLYTYVRGVDWDGFELHVGHDAFGGVFPTHDDEACVWLIQPTAAATAVLTAGARRADAWREILLGRLPRLERRLHEGRIVGRLRGAVGLPNHVRAAAGPGWALVGDAGYHRDPITGHGMTDAFRDAELLADAVRRWRRHGEPEHVAMAGYAAARDHAIREIFAITRALARFPPVPRFLDLQYRLADALDAEATALAESPSPLNTNQRKEHSHVRHPGTTPQRGRHPQAVRHDRCGA